MNFKLANRPPRRPSRRRRLRYIQTLPTLCTLGNLICGFGAITLCFRALWLAGGNNNPADVITLHNNMWERLLPSHLVMAAYLVFLAMVFDALDGRLARWTRFTTDFGAQLDSLCDIVSFGVVPPLLMIALLTRQLQGSSPLVVTPFSSDILGRLAWVAAAIYAACAALRLARFNVENQEVEQAHQTFLGLPSPGAAGALACLVILHDHVFFYDAVRRPVVAKMAGAQGGLLSDMLLVSLPILAVVLGLLMVSRYEYFHFVNRYLRGRRTFAGMIRVLFILVGVWVYPEITVGVLVLVYALSGPLRQAWLRSRKRPGTSLADEGEIIDAEGPHESAG
ncbi:MAG: hypothetical protein HJJLKODD_01485 [Phycisphaerae bacterium]|nr:hypothetical protein [Phycisphaerae bacterium]